VKHRD
jgi:replicative superfamily II helicase